MRFSKKISTTAKHHVFFGFLVCRQDQFQCDANKCIDKEKHCDGIVDCNDATDEKLCCKFDSVSGVSIVPCSLCVQTVPTRLKKIHFSLPCRCRCFCCPSFRISDFRLLLFVCFVFCRVTIRTWQRYLL